MTDLISRSALLEKEWLTEAVDGYPIRVVEVGDILDASTIEAEPIIHAKWEKVTANGVYWYRCSNCHESVSKDRYGYDYFSRRCPGCGAHMEDVDE